MFPFAMLLAGGLGLATAQTPAPAAPPSTEALAQAYFLYLQGHELEDSGDMDGAAAAYRKILALVPEAAEVRADLATLYAQTGKATDALTEALQALKSDPANRQAHRVMGFVQSALADTEIDSKRQANLISEAIGHLEKAIGGGPPDLSGELALGRLYVQAEQPQKAVPVLKSFLAERPNYPDAVMALADAYEALHQRREAIDLIETLVADQPADTRARSRLAGLYEQAGRWSDAASAWGEVARRNPQVLSFRSRRATALANAGDYDASRAELSSLTKDAPRDVSFWYLLSQVERRSGHAAAAEEAARHIADLDPKDPRGTLALAEAKIAGKDYRGATSVLQPLVASAVDADIQSGVFALAAGQLAIALEGNGQQADAVKTLEDARRRSPDDDDLTLGLAALYDRSKDLSKAESTYRDVIAHDAGNAEALNDLGYMLADHGLKLDEAVGLIKRALMLDPENPSFLDSLGWAYVKHGRPADGRPSLERAAGALPKDSVIQDHLGEACFLLKDYKSAAAAWDRALAGDLNGIDSVAVTKKRDRARELAGR